MKRCLLIGLTIIGAIVSYWGVSHAITKATGAIIDKILGLPEKEAEETKETVTD